MKYYKVKPEYDNATRWKYKGHSNLIIKEDGILIGNELYTARERERLANTDRFFDAIEIPKNKIYWFFGARFAIGSPRIDYTLIDGELYQV